MATTQITQSRPLVTDAMHEQFVRDGFFVIESVMPAEHLEIVRNAAATCIEAIHDRMTREGRDVWGINVRDSRYFIGNQAKDLPGFGRVLYSDYMAEICRVTLGPDAYLFNEQFVIKAAEKGMKFDWHQDSGYVPFPHREYLSCWCALDDMTIENGTVYMLPYGRAGIRQTATHTRKADTNDLVGYTGDDPGDPVICPAGSIAVFSSNCFHRSGTNTTSKMRRVHLAQYSAEPIVNPQGKVQIQAVPFLKDGKIITEVRQ